MNRFTGTAAICLAAVAVAVVLRPVTGIAADSPSKRIVFVAGRPSHGPGEHEYRAGCLLLSRCLNQVPGITSVVYSNGWPQDVHAFDGADAIVLSCDGANGHIAIQDHHLQALAGLMDKGIGLGCLHWAVEVPKDNGGPQFLDWIGGYFETYHSVNPIWTADFKTLPRHPVTRGVHPFRIRDEWYYHMRFRDHLEGITPILTAIPPDRTRGRPGANDPYGGNPDVQKHRGEPECTMWVYQRPDGGRGFGFTGAHYHENWGNANFRKVVLNAIVWIAKAEVPPNGVASTVTEEELKQNLDRK
jgi:type 1 glutamine amidotransferase